MSERLYDKMGLTYHEAIHLIESEAQRHRQDVESRTEKVPLHQALNRVTGHALLSPQSTPRCDTSAMDGYALNSEATKNASPENPVSFRVQGLMAAGKESLPETPCPGCECQSQGLSCLEIMTGGRFPSAAESGILGLDCCVKFEDVTRVTEPAAGKDYIRVTKPVKYRQNRRIAGEDFQHGQVIVPAATTIRPHHIMALASVGFQEIPVLPKLRVGLYSTGSELLSQNGNGPETHLFGDINGPYIAATLADIGVDVHFLGVLDDDVEAMTQKLECDLREQQYDLIISTGAVSTGRFDLIPHTLQRLGAHTVFHKVAMRPGHPALFASLPGKSSQGLESIPFFGLPGNPVASAACLRFLVVPYLNFLQSKFPEQPVKAQMSFSEGMMNGHQAKSIAKFPGDRDVFRAGTFGYSADGKVEATLIQDHSPGKIRPFLGANCWIHMHRGVTELREGDIVDIFPDA